MDSEPINETFLGEKIRLIECVVKDECEPKCQIVGNRKLVVFVRPGDGLEGVVRSLPEVAPRAGVIVDISPEDL